ncbi:nitrogenase iron-molybdenum cofactor biosynthesis protein NifE [Natronospora cellulosivora (SeqCode)]
MEIKKFKTLEERKKSISLKVENKQADIDCHKESLAGAVSQRACVYSGARVVLNPITDAYHLVHGPIGCASYTWDIRGSLSSGEETYRNSFSTDLREKDIIFGGEEKLDAAISELVEKYQAKFIFVYATCVVGVIGDDIEAICRKAEEEYNITVIPVQAAGFAGNKMSGYKAAGQALLELMNKKEHESISEEIKENNNIKISRATPKINLLGDFNLAGEMWIIKDYLSKIGLEVNAGLTGDSNCQQIMKVPEADLNIVQCAGSMVFLAKRLKKKYGIPFMKISFVGIEDTVSSLYKIAEFFSDYKMQYDIARLVEEKYRGISQELDRCCKNLAGKKAAIYVGGGFKAISLIKQFKSLGMQTALVGTQTGNAEDYQTINELVDEGTVILDDANPNELEYFMREKEVDILAGGVKERPLAYKLGVAFCDHNHERKHPLLAFEGALNFAREVDQTINSPVWKYVRRELL